MKVQVGVRRGQDELEVRGRRSLPEIYTLLLIQPENQKNYHFFIWCFLLKCASRTLIEELKQK